MATRAIEALYWIREIPPALVVVDTRAEGARILVPELRRQGREIVALNDDSTARQDALEAGCIQAHPASTEVKELAQLVAALVGSRDVRRIGTIEAGALLVDLSSRRLVFEGRQIAVSALLLNLAAHLASRKGSFVPTSVLLREVWAEPWADPAKVHIAVHRLRGRLGLGPHSSFLTSRRGQGYAILPTRDKTTVRLERQR